MGKASSDQIMPRGAELGDEEVTRTFHHFETLSTHTATVDVIACSVEQWRDMPESSAPGWDVVHVTGGGIVAARLTL
jgi:hypothetical protein